MAINSVHPLYAEMYSSWKLGRDSYDGEKEIKKATTTYLPATSGQIADGQGTSSRSPGQLAYNAYLKRSYYPGIYKEAVEAAIGVMHRKPPTIELPPVLEPMIKDATLLGESLELLLRKINTRQLITGRLGLLGDIRVDENSIRPIIVTYNELAILNWDDTSLTNDDVDVRLIVLDESGYERENDLSWSYKNKYRLLGLTDENMLLADKGVYGSTLINEEKLMSIEGTQLPPPSIMGNTLNEIPFVFINSKDLSPSPDNPPLEGLANLCLVIYRGESDYRQNLFMQGEDTLVRIGAMGDDDESIRTGAGARIDVPMGGDAKYIGVSSNGLPEQRLALENDYRRAIQKSGQLLDATSRAKESGDALRIRVAAQTATLPLIAKAGAAGLEKVLKSLARWYGANPDEVVIKPNLEFTESDLNGQTLVQILQAKGLGAPLSYESIHSYMAEQGFTRQTYEQEIEKILNEQPGDDVNGGMLNDINL